VLELAEQMPTSSSPCMVVNKESDTDLVGMMDISVFRGQGMAWHGRERDAPIIHIHNQLGG
jgi:hypothetical protein